LQQEARTVVSGNGTYQIKKLNNRFYVFKLTSRSTRELASRLETTAIYMDSKP